jgi:hypothetical protein
MVAISPSQFQVERDYQVELNKDPGGQFNTITMYWDDGWTEVNRRLN